MKVKELKIYLDSFDPEAEVVRISTDHSYEKVWSYAGFAIFDKCYISEALETTPGAVKVVVIE